MGEHDDIVTEINSSSIGDRLEFLYKLFTDSVRFKWYDEIYQTDGNPVEIKSPERLELLGQLLKEMSENNGKLKMSEHINVEFDENTVPYFAIHSNDIIAGFFGPFRFLSNFYPVKGGVGLDEIVYPSVEHAYQAAKWPVEQRAQFVSVTAGQSKKLGRLAPDFDQKRWNKQKYELMYHLNWQKYQNDIKLRMKLVVTEGFLLEERNSWGDTDWGTNVKGDGDNNLGKILMRVRDKLLARQRDDEF